MMTIAQNSDTEQEGSLSDDVDTPSSPLIPLVLPRKRRANPFFRMRAAKSSEKSAILFTEAAFLQQLETLDPERLAKAFDEIDGHRPIARTGTPSPGGRPGSAYTPNGTKLTVRDDFGFCLVFHLQADDRPAKTQAAPELGNVPRIASIKSPPREPYKYKEIKVTTKLLQESKKLRAVQKNRQPADQQTTMATGAKAEAGATKIMRKLLGPGDRNIYEWLHLIAYFILANKAQESGNLVIGPKGTNTIQMIPEGELAHLCELYPSGIKLQVKADVLPNTHIATKIHYTIVTDDFILPFVFNARDFGKPNVKDKLYIEKISDLLVEATLDRFGLNQSVDMVDSDSEINNQENESQELIAKDSIKQSSAEQKIEFGQKQVPLARVLFPKLPNNLHEDEESHTEITSSPESKSKGAWNR